MPKERNCNIAIVGLGYVGLPLFCLLSSKHTCWGMDIDTERVNALMNGVDFSECVSSENIMSALDRSNITSSWDDIANCDFYIVTVPTPIDTAKKPDVSALKTVCERLGGNLKRGNIIVFESTVYPGATEDICIPILEQVSGLKLNVDFYVGYSPERINVGDKVHQLISIPKLVSASIPTVLDYIAGVYQSVLEYPVVKTSSIKVAEAAKMYENIQRDVLIALANEYADYCRSEEIAIDEVTECSSSKWNFSKVLPGLVGGHCIGVDPYYLLKRAETKGIDLQIVKTARSVNEAKTEQVADRIISILEKVSDNTHNARILILGFSYKVGASDIRNTKIADIVRVLSEKTTIDCYDPLVNRVKVMAEYNICLLENRPNFSDYDMVFIAVNHEQFNDVIYNCRRRECSTIINLADVI